MADDRIALHAGTPQVVVHISSGTPVCTLRLLRHPDTQEDGGRWLNSRTSQDWLRRTVSYFGARTLAQAHPDARSLTTLGGASLLLSTADAGDALSLADAAGRPLWRRSAQGTVTRCYYQPCPQAGWPLYQEQQWRDPEGHVQCRVCERFSWGSADESGSNLAGAVIQHYHSAGITYTRARALTGGVSRLEERLLLPEAGLPDWESSPEMEAPLTVTCRYDASGAVLVETAVSGVTLYNHYSLTGALWLQRAQRSAGEAAEEIQRISVRTAAGQMLVQRHGNGTETLYAWHPQTQRQTRQALRRVMGEWLCDLRSEYDPAGNLTTVTDVVAATAWHNGRRTLAQRHYGYDTLYRLVQAEGRERLSVSARGVLPGRRDGGGAAWYPWRESYHYDDGDNLTYTQHAGERPWTRRMTVSTLSNRSVVEREGETAGPEAAFLAGGLQRRLADGRSLSWHPDGQLAQVSPVVRVEEMDDTEHYVCRDGGTRMRRVRRSRVSGGWQREVTTWCGGAERRERYNAAGLLTQAVAITEAEGMRIICSGLSGEVFSRWRFSCHGAGVQLETDVDGRVTSREEFYPYGGSAGADEEASEIADRTRRYSGQVRDATGLYCYGWRYYQPETGRWLSADPGGLIDGVNLFRMCRNSPLRYQDNSGLAPDDDVKQAYFKMLSNGRLFRNARKMINQIDEKVTLDNAVDTMARLTEKNLFRQREEMDRKRVYEKGIVTEFIDNIENSPVTLFHFTSEPFIRDGEDGMILSRNKLMAAGKLPFRAWNNTTQGDMETLATTGFAFFSPVFGHTEKKSSKFGNHSYSIDWNYNEPHMDYMMAQTHDLLFASTRKIPTGYVSVYNKIAANERDISNYNNALVKRFARNDSDKYDYTESGKITLGSVFTGRNEAQEGIINAVAIDLAQLSNETLASITPEIRSNLNGVVTTFYRPQILVPGSVTLRRNSYQQT